MRQSLNAAGQNANNTLRTPCGALESSSDRLVNPLEPWAASALVVSVALLVNACLLWSLQRWSRRQRHPSGAVRAEYERAATTHQAVGDIHQGVAGLGQVVQGTRQRIAELERQFRMLEGATQQISRRQSVQRAIQLARGGAVAEDIAQHCSLTAAESRLLTQVHTGLHSH